MDASKYSPIGCGDYDYLEIACMDRYEVEISTNDEIIHGFAVNLEVQKGEEYLVLRSNRTTESKIRIDQINHLRVKTRPCRFKERTFGKEGPMHNVPSCPVS